MKTLLCLISSLVENLQMTGGIILIYSQENMIYKNTNVKVFIKHCYISNINSSTKIEHKGKNSVISLDRLSHTIGLIIHQPLIPLYMIYKDIIITNITTVNGPIFLVSSKLCALSLKLKNSSFSNNKNKLHPVVNYL